MIKTGGYLGNLHTRSVASSVFASRQLLKNNLIPQKEMLLDFCGHVKARILNGLFFFCQTEGAQSTLDLLIL